MGYRPGLVADLQDERRRRATGPIGHARRALRHLGLHKLWLPDERVGRVHWHCEFHAAFFHKSGSQ